MHALRTVAGAALLLAMAATARPEDACVVDARRLCPNVPYGGGAVLECLRGRWFEVSSACQQTIQDVDNRARQVDIACSNDVFRFCPRVPVGQGRVLSCLTNRWNELTSTCQDAVARIAEKVNTLSEACSADAARLCQGVEPGGGRLFACLKFQERAVSSRCAAALRP